MAHRNPALCPPAPIADPSGHLLGEGTFVLRAALEAARSGAVRCLETVLSRGLPVGVRAGKIGGLLLRAAALGGHEGAVRTLIAAGAPPDQAGEDGRTPLMYAALFDHAGSVRILLEAGADPSLRDAWNLRARDLAESHEAWGAFVALDRP
jgi:uncharacterized protein